MSASGRDINPDVIGYIFEKYINDRAAMGAYYTREDITGYIARNTILPHLLRRAKDGCKEAFDSKNGTIWKLLRENPEHYIYPAMRKGADLPDSDLPEHIHAGLDSQSQIPDLLKRREKWNTAAAEKWALPSETWREALERRRRCNALIADIKAGRVCDIADLTARNLDIEKLTLAALQQHEGSDFISAFYAAVAGRAARENSPAKERRGIAVLDPACGSGAFLFAALKVLEPLYKICVERMREFVAEADQLGKPKKHEHFRAVLTDINSHTNEEYWIYRSIVLGNLFGADIMPEAAEVAKLRLFLKLAAAAEKDDNKTNMGLEPLPDIDFNIRSGNALVGFASMEEFREQVEKTLDLTGRVKRVYLQAGVAAVAHRRFINAQRDGVITDIGTKEFAAAKATLNVERQKLNDEFDRYLAVQYGVSHEIGDMKISEPLLKWKESHKPFHWATEFYDIMQSGGFDVVIGNPPYVGMNKIPYNLVGDFSCSNIYGYFIAKSLDMLADGGSIGLIVMFNCGSVEGFDEARVKIQEDCRDGCFSFYGRIPSGLFVADVRVRNCIMLAQKRESAGKSFTTRLHRWNTVARENLFSVLSYAPFRFESEIPRFNTGMLSQFSQNYAKARIGRYETKRGAALCVRRSVYNFISVSKEPPPCYDAKGLPVRLGTYTNLFFADKKTRDLALLLLAGRMSFSFWLTYGDDFSITQPTIARIPFPAEIMENPSDVKALTRIFNKWESCLESTLQFKKNAGKDVGTYNTSRLWHITDESDLIFLKHMTDSPEKVLDEITTHVVSTIKTPLKEAADE